MILVNTDEKIPDWIEKELWKNLCFNEPLSAMAFMYHVLKDYTLWDTAVAMGLTDDIDLVGYLLRMAWAVLWWIPQGNKVDDEYRVIGNPKSKVLVGQYHSSNDEHLKSQQLRVFDRNSSLPKR